MPPGDDSWVVGEELYVSLHIIGSEGVRGVTNLAPLGADR